MKQGRTLAVAPYIGEFGWELMNWQGRVRWLARHGGYERVVVCARPDRRRLYAADGEGATWVFCPMPYTLWPGAACDDHRVDAEGVAYPPQALRERVVGQMRTVCTQLGMCLRDAEILTPEYGSQLWPTSATHQAFANLRMERAIETDVVMVPRNRTLAAERNQSVTWWEELAAQLRERGLRVEMYGQGLGRAIEQLSRARLAVGVSTGGLHLASLCGCPHYVWGSGAEARWTAWQITNRQRYETLWNPLGTPCIYDECGWRPGMDHVVRRTIEALEKIGLRGAVRARRAGRAVFRPRWAIKRGLARVLEAQGAARWPWRVERLVREHLV